MSKPKLRCAIYTRKSSEEGLEQDFNSLDAQRESCEAYITSQAGEGWTLVRTHYDDGGYSGGNIERPALKELLAAIDAGKIDVVVVYKVDRLTRSLSDFAKIIDRFDAKKVSFVSVTQAFNTTTSMGRLTLNVLLSFAQFEREVTGERIRDKIAASKAKGLWMGGTVPLGYDPDERTLRVNKKEAETVRWIFQRYTELKSVDALVAELAERGIRSKAGVSRRGRRVGGFPIVRGALNYMLQNPLYLGQIRHKDKVFTGQHEPIVSRQLWEQVQRTLTGNRVRRKDQLTRAHVEWWLTGKLFDATGRPMTPTYTSKNGKRYKYYAVQLTEEERTSSAPALVRVRMNDIHQIVEAAYSKRDLRSTQPGMRRNVQEEVSKVSVERNRIVIELIRSVPTIQDAKEAKKRGGGTNNSRIQVPIRIAKHGQKSEIVPPADLGIRRPLDARLVDTLRQAWQWRQDLEDGTYASIEVLAEAKRLTKRYVNLILLLGFMPPQMLKAGLAGYAS